jgi:hypothetical protein
MASLFEITAEIRKLDELFDEFGNADDNAKQIILDALTASEGAFADKADNYCALIAEYNAQAAARAGEADRLRGLASVDANKAEALKARLEEAMRLLDVQKMQTARYKLGIQKNGGKAPLVIDCAPENLPFEYQRARIEADKDAIREALEGGAEIKGCSIGDRGESLRIK